MSGILAGFFLYQWKQNWLVTIKAKCEWIHYLLIHRYFVDDFYDWILEHVQKPIAEFCERFEHRIVIEKMVNGTARFTALLGDASRKFQTGQIQTYLAFFFTGLVIILYWFAVRGL